MPNFACNNCQKTLGVPDAYIGKQVRCPSCGSTLRVPAVSTPPPAAGGSVYDMDVFGGNDTAPPPPTQGKKRPAPPKISPMEMDAPGVDADSQTQMRELKELNELRHSGAISRSEYKRRKSEIYAGRSLVSQATSRSSSGGPTGEIVQMGGAGMPWYLKWGAGVVVLAIFAGVGWYFVQTMSNPAVEPEPDGPDQPGPTVVQTPVEVEPEVVVPDEPELLLATLVPAMQETSIFQIDPDEPEVGTTIFKPTAAYAPIEIAEKPKPTLFSKFFEGPDAKLQMTPRRYDRYNRLITQEVDSGFGMVDATGTSGKITRWPISWDDATPAEGEGTGIDRVCTVIKQISKDGNTAYIGAGVGPWVTNMEDDLYETYRDRVRQTYEQTARDAGNFEDMIITSTQRPVRVANLMADRMFARPRSDRSQMTLVITAEQDNHCVTYWFTGSSALYNDFAETVGKAIIEGEQPPESSRPVRPEIRRRR